MKKKERVNKEQTHTIIIGVEPPQRDKGDDCLMQLAIRDKAHTYDDVSKSNKEDGLLPKYNISKANGKPVSPEAEYFVLRLDNNDSDELHVWACRKALVAYANELRRCRYLTQLSDDLMNCWGWETVARMLMTEARVYCGAPYSESKIMVYVTQLTEAIKEFDSVCSLFRINDDTLRTLALSCLTDNNNKWYSDTPKFNKLRDVLKGYAELIK